MKVIRTHMKTTRILLASLALLGLTIQSYAQEAPPSPVVPAAAKPSAELHEDEAWKIATDKIAGKKIESEFQPDGPIWIFHILDKTGHECVVTVAQKTRSVVKAIVPRLTMNQALAIALKKAPGKRDERHKDMSTFNEKPLTHTFYIEPKKGALKSVTVSDKTGKVVSVRDMGDVG
jgi:uncharacterized membrane protein YkoI